MTRSFSLDLRARMAAFVEARIADALWRALGDIGDQFEPQEC